MCGELHGALSWLGFWTQVCVGVGRPLAGAGAIRSASSFLEEADLETRGTSQQPVGPK